MKKVILALLGLFVTVLVGLAQDVHLSDVKSETSLSERSDQAIEKPYRQKTKAERRAERRARKEYKASRKKERKAAKKNNRGSWYDVDAVSVED